MKNKWFHSWLKGYNSTLLCYYNPLIMKANCQNTSQVERTFQNVGIGYVIGYTIIVIAGISWYLINGVHNVVVHVFGISMFVVPMLMVLSAPPLHWYLTWRSKKSH